MVKMSSIELLTTQELAEYLKLNPQTILRKARAGELPAIRLGKEFRFLKSQIDQWLLSKTVAHLQVSEKAELSIEALADIPWGTHLCLFYQTKEDLFDILVPYFKAGLERNQFCFWVTSEPLDVREATKAMQEAMPDFDQCLKRGQIEIVFYTDWYLKDNRFDSQRVLSGFIDKLSHALVEGYEGMRVAANLAWLEREYWKTFNDYEEQANNSTSKYKVIAICAYSLDKCGVLEALDVVHNHQFALVRREGEWELIGSAERKRAVEEVPSAEAKFSSLAKHSLVGICIIQDGKFLYVNPRITEILGYTEDELLSLESVLDIIAEDDRTLVAENIRKRVEGKVAILHYACRARRKDGALIDLEIMGARIEVDGKPAIIGMALDITKQNRIKNALSEADEKCRLLFNSAPVGIGISDLEGNVLNANQTMLEMTGFMLDDFKVVKLGATYVDPGERQRLLRTLQETGHVRDWEVKLKRKDGTVYLALLNIDQVEIGARTLLLTTQRDITKLRQTEEALRMSEECFRHIVEVGADGVWVCDSDNNTVFVNQKMAGMLGYTGDEIMDAPLFTFVDEELRAFVADKIERRHQGIREQYEFRLRRKDGTELQTFVSSNPIFDSKGQYAGLLAIFSDISKDKETVENLHLMFESMADGIAVTDLNGVIIQVNSRMLEICGFSSKDEVLWKTHFEFIAPRDHKRLEVNMRRLLKLGRIENNVYTLIKKDGSRIPVEVGGSVLKDESGNPVGFVGILRDVTQRKQAETMLIQT